MMRWLAALLLMASLPAAAAPPWLAGKWFGTGQPGDRSEMFLDSMGADGKFQAHHRWCRKGKPLDQYQAGTWTLKGDLLTINVVTVNGQPSPESDPYRIVSHDAHSQKYVYLPINFAYTSSRVANGFDMPSCELTS
ncbi:MAG: hypothetical protein JWN16_286 [Alphaproteobacteria bacterium]|nr:hypothetical protein [Alphaproteobacteria bacterium]